MKAFPPNTNKTIYALLFSAFLITLSIFPAQLTAQHEECGTIETVENLKNRKAVRANLAYQQFVADFMEKKKDPLRSGEVLTSVPIKAHIIRQTNGTGGLTAQQLEDAITIMNGYYKNANIEFVLCGGINYINNSTYYDFEQSEQSALIAAHQTDDVVNIYFANSVRSSSGSSLCGYAYYPGGPNVVVMQNGCTRNGSTLSHELGHFFALPHTHGGSPAELVDGSNCSDAGDDFCDTPADPRLSSGTVSSSCVYTGTATDANGDLYMPEPRNIMSYSRKSCRTLFSMEQYATMAYTLISSRAYLKCPDFSLDFTASATESCDLPFTVNFSAQTVGGTSFKWDFDNDGIVDATDQNPSYTFTTPGTFDVNLTVANGQGEEIQKTKPALITVGGQQIDYSQDFEGFLAASNATGLYGGWTTSPANITNQFRWNVDQNGTGTSGTGPLTDHGVGSRRGVYMYTEASSGSSGDVANLISPCIIIPADAGSPFVEFWYHMYGSNIGSLHLDIYDGSQWINDIITPLSGQQQTGSANPYQLASSSLLAYAGQQIQLRLRAIRGGGSSGDIAIDDFRIYDNNAPPKVSFLQNSFMQEESSESGSFDCRGYKDLIYNIQPTNLVTGGEAVLAILPSGTATRVVDYRISPDTLRWPDGTFDEKSFTVRIFDDGEVESTESIVLTLDVSGNSNLGLDNNGMSTTISIEDNDLDISDNGAITQKDIEKADFESPDFPQGWTRTQQPNSTGFIIGTPADLSSSSVSVPSAGRNLILGANDDACNCDASRDIVALPPIDLSQAATATLIFDYFLPGNYSSEGSVEVFLDGNNSDTPDQVFDLAESTVGWQQFSMDLDNFINNSALRIQIVHNDNGRWADGLFIDNLVLSAVKPLEVANLLAASGQEYLGPNATVFFFDDNSGDLIAKIENLSDWDYGCTTVAIDRSGTNVIPFIDDSPEFFVTEKTLLVSPTNNNPTGSYNIKIYFTDAEIAGWEAATNNPKSTMMLIKSPANISNVSPLNPFANGVNDESISFVNGAFATDHFYVSAQFDNGFGGFGGARGLGSIPLPVELIDFRGEITKAGQHRLIWETASERNSDYFELQRATDGQSFVSIATKPAAGFSTQSTLYRHLDALPAKGVNYYRLRQVDQDGSVEFSPIISLENLSGNRKVSIYPNPTRDLVQIEMAGLNESSQIRLYNSLGQLVIQQPLAAQATITTLDLSVLAKGIYFLELNSGKEVLHYERLIKN